MMACSTCGTQIMIERRRTCSDECLREAKARGGRNGLHGDKVRAGRIGGPIGGRIGSHEDKVRAARIGGRKLNETWGKTPEAREARARGARNQPREAKIRGARKTNTTWGKTLEAREAMARGGRIGGRIAGRISARIMSHKRPTWPEVRFYGLVLGDPITALGFSAQQSDGHGIYDGAWLDQKIIAELDGGGHHAFRDRHAEDTQKDIMRMLDYNTVLREEDENIMFLKALAILGAEEPK